MRYIDIGFGNLAAADRVLCVASADSSPIRRVISEAKDRSMLVDACAGRKCRSVLVMDSDHIVTSSLDVSEIQNKLEGAS
jgi:regulator of extracellular matrix RemA (YlzA/DUF370 family)